MDYLEANNAQNYKVYSNVFCSSILGYFNLFHIVMLPSADTKYYTYNELFNMH